MGVIFACMSAPGSPPGGVTGKAIVSASQEFIFRFSSGEGAGILFVFTSFIAIYVSFSRLLNTGNRESKLCDPI